jgi:RNA-binding protein
MNADKRKLKSEAQRLEPVVTIGKQGVTDAVCASLDAALAHHGLVKVRFGEFKEQRKELAAQLAASSSSELITLVGHVAVFYRPRAD